jgi:diguanylate cyclase (GGDEF)-like protein
LKKGRFFGIIIGLSQKQKMGNRPNENKGSRKRQNNGDLLPFVTGDPEAGDRKLEMSPSMDDIVQRHGISELRKAIGGVIALKKEAEGMSTMDKLTGLPNRRAYDQTIEKEIEQSKRGKHPLSFIIVDIDHFKVVNDVEGHEIGDLVLRAVGNILKQNIRAGDTVARIGGEEFGIILPETDLGQAKVVAEKLLQAVKAETQGKAEHKPVTISGGYALFGNQHITNKEELEKSAGKALNEAKREGRNRMLPFQMGRKTNPEALKAHAKAHVVRVIPEEMDLENQAKMFRELMEETERKLAENRAKKNTGTND